MSIAQRCLVAVLTVVCVWPAAAQQADEGWISLFNGTDLTGWTPKIRGYELGEDPMRTFRVEDGAIKVSYDQYETFDNHFGHLFYNTPYGHYKMKLEYRFTGEQCPGGAGWAKRNSGIMIHGQDPATMAKDQNFPVSIEVQLLGGLGNGTRHTANLCTPGTNVVMKGELHTPHCTTSTSPTFDGDEWVTCEIEVHGNGLIRHFVNGEQVLEYEQAQLDPKDGDAKKLIVDGKLMLDGGSISLQSESHPCEFRNIMLLPLDE